MRILSRIEAYLRRAIGLNSASLGAFGVAAAVRERMRAEGINDEDAYLALLESSAQEQNLLVERIVIPETWFFRDEQPFRAFRQYAQRHWQDAGVPAGLRYLLSIPCATGEEPYSMAMTLLDLGLPPSTWRIHACDVSQAVLDKARKGVYRQHSFRSHHLDFRDRYFRNLGSDYLLDESVRATVHFERANIVAPDFIRGRPRYDVIFFRNLMIYLADAERTQALTNLEYLLSREGILFVGHSEAGLLPSERFVPAGYSPGAFAFRRRPSAPPATFPRVPPPRPREEGPLASRPLVLPRSPPARAESPPVAAIPPATPEPAPLLMEARAAADRGDLEQADRMCQSALRTGQQQADGFCLLGLVRDAQGRSAEAETCLRKALYLEPGHQEALAHLTLIVERRGDTAAAGALRARADRRQRSAGP